MSQIIAISNQKGGVAKTTTCSSLGACIAELGKKVLIVDLDSQAHLTIATGFDPEDLEATLVDLLNAFNADQLSEGKQAIQNTQIEGLDILPADLRLAALERFVYEQDDYERILAQILAPLEIKYDYILLDCPPSLGAITLMALTAAQSVLIPVQCEFYAVRGLSRLLDIIAGVQERTNPDLTYYLVATLFDQRNRICRGVLDQLRTNFPAWLMDTIIAVDTRIRECPATGEPITLYAPNTRASHQYRQLASEFHDKIHYKGMQRNNN